MEAFCAEHKIEIDQILYEWPASKFEAFYEAYAKRKVADELSQRRALEMASVWGNTNMDSDKDPELRRKFQEQIDEGYSNAIASLYGETTPEKEQEGEIESDNPFWQAAKRGIEKRRLPEPKING